MCQLALKKYFLTGPILASFRLIFAFAFSWLYSWLQLTNFTMANDERKQERRRKKMSCCIVHYLEKAHHPVKHIDSISVQKKSSRLNQGFQPSLLGQNAIALPLVPPPLPGFVSMIFSHNDGHSNLAFDFQVNRSD